MVNRKVSMRIRKVHRYLGVFLGIQFLFWTISGLYFSWTDIDEIHGDHLMKPMGEKHQMQFEKLSSPSELVNKPIYSIGIKEINHQPYYWINESELIHARTGIEKENITQEEAKEIANSQMVSGLVVKEIKLLTEVGKHHEYRGKPLPVWEITYDHLDHIKAYVSAADGTFQKVRFRAWRWFDFLWMTHTMDYEGRDDFNNIVLRAFSLLGLITVLSGFVLWFVSSATVRRLFNKSKQQ